MQRNCSSITLASRTHLRFNVPGVFAWQQLNLQGTHSCQTGGQEQIRSNQCEPCNVASSLSYHRGNTALAQCFGTPFGADLSVSAKGWSSSCCVPGKIGFSADHETRFIKLPLWLITALAKWAKRGRSVFTFTTEPSMMWESIVEYSPSWLLCRSGSQAGLSCEAIRVLLMERHKALPIT